MKPTSVFTDEHVRGRARKTAVVLGIAVLSFLVYWPNRAAFGSGQAIIGTFYTLAFVAAALFLLAGREVLDDTAGVWRNAALATAPLLFAMFGRYWIEKAPDALQLLAHALLYATPAAAGVVLLAFATMDWSGTARIEPDAALTPVK